jgi:hypothetical protein
MCGVKCAVPFATVRAKVSFFNTAENSLHADGNLGKSLINGVGTTGNRTCKLLIQDQPGSVYRNIVIKYGRETGISLEVIGMWGAPPRSTYTRTSFSMMAPSPAYLRFCRIRCGRCSSSS